MSRKQFKRRAGSMVFSAIAGFFILAAVGSVGFGVATAETTDELARAGAFGFDEATHSATVTARVSDAAVDAPGDAAASEHSALAKSSARDITAGLKMIDGNERAAAERRQAEDAAAIERVEAGKAKQAAQDAPETQAVADEAPSYDASEYAAAPYDSTAYDAAAVGVAAYGAYADATYAATTTYDYSAAQPVQQTQTVEQTAPTAANTAEDPADNGLSEVDWSVGKEEFLDEWSGRIDEYLEGSNLEGYGSTFAEAAWENGVDPRWSPSIANTESGKGEACFLSYNAWGWGSSSWTNWEDAINDHVAGLAEGYGYTITEEGAATYCPPNAAAWYDKTLNEMESI